MKKYLIVFLCLILCVSALPIFGEASDSFIVKVESKTAKPGDKVELKVELVNNPGVLAMLFVLDYDDTKLKLTGASDGKLLSGGLFGNDFSAKPFKLLWNSASSTNFTEDGTLVTLEFEVLPEALSGFSEVTLGYKQKNIYDVNLEDVELTVENGGITIEGNEPPPPQTGGGGGGYTPIIKPDKKPEKEPEKEPDYVIELMSFSDVSEKDWFYEGVKYAYDNKLMKGVSRDVFSPDATLTRGMFVTVLYRFANEPEAGTNNFSDVPLDSWYSDAVSWAYNNKIVSGVSETEFCPGKEVTREQMAAIIYRYIKSEDDKNNNDILSFSDYCEISEYAVPAFNYAVKNGIINGTSENTISPKANATRAQAAAIFMRLSQLEK